VDTREERRTKDKRGKRSKNRDSTEGNSIDFALNLEKMGFGGPDGSVAFVE